MGDSLDALEEEAAARRKRGGGREAGQPRFPRKAGGGDSRQDADARSAELQARERERELRRQQVQASEEPAPAPEPEAIRTSPREEGPQLPPVEPAAPKARRSRPTSMPFYPNPEHEDFLWSIAEAAAARQSRIPATAVLRLALSRLQDQMTPSEIVRELGSSVHPEGKMGRPRL